MTTLIQNAHETLTGFSPTGAVIDFMGSSSPAGWLLLSGQTIGNTGSGGTSRANVDSEALFTLLWDSIANTELPIQDSAGAPSTRGASAAADFAANKRMPLPDMRGRVTAGKDDMGGSAANRMTSGGASINGATLGASGGSQTHTLTIPQMPSHTHNLIIRSGNAGSVTEIPNGGQSSAYTNTQIQATGGGGAHNNTQPTFIMNKIIKL
jgi:microcystin-dependent protein